MASDDLITFRKARNLRGWEDSLFLYTDGFSKGGDGGCAASDLVRLIYLFPFCSLITCHFVPFVLGIFHFFLFLLLLWVSFF